MSADFTSTHRYAVDSFIAESRLNKKDDAPNVLAVTLANSFFDALRKLIVRPKKENSISYAFIE